MAIDLLQRVRVVLVETKHPGNIGAAARAAKTMGVGELWLVAPAEFPSRQAAIQAAGALDLLQRAKVVEELTQAVNDCGLVIGTSARERRIPWPLIDPREGGRLAVAEARHHPVALVFGREDRGLTNEELQRCTHHLHIPADPQYPSLNLAMAVQVLCYEVRMAWLEAQGGRGLASSAREVPAARHADLERFFQHLEETLVTIGYLDPENPRQTMARLRRIFLRARCDEKELALLRGVLTATQEAARSRGDEGRH
ncbi:MAG: tRNA (cytidine/uridine-2'-O-)-methyltransferase TrmJ [Porticoccaceae bacterium]|nr:MAG: tRNA (cytidine/uridine-2'-O-)-methyltransferase TrmJ [Porticoccaceae bacterium]